MFETTQLEISRNGHFTWEHHLKILTFHWKPPTSNLWSSREPGFLAEGQTPVLREDLLVLLGGRLAKIKHQTGQFLCASSRFWSDFHFSIFLGGAMAYNSLYIYIIYIYIIIIIIITSSAAQGGGGSFKNRKPIGDVGCCESGMAERSHWLTERWLELCLLEWLQWLQWSPHPQLLDVVWCTATVVVVVA